MNSSSAQTIAQKEEEELAKAIALSLKESTSSQSLNKQPTSKKIDQSVNNVSSLYGSLNLNKRESLLRKKVKALYDFEAVEDNEITFKAGDILYVTDNSDQNWWKGVDLKNKEGLFPSNFVTADLDYEDEANETNINAKKVSFNDNVDVKSLEKQKKIHILIDEKKIDECIDLLQNADPTGEIQPDTHEMLQLEDQCYMMGPLIDQQLQKIDYKHALLDDLNMKLIEAFQMYNNLMKESITKTTGNFVQQPHLQIPSSFNPSQGYIPFVAAPPQTDTSPYNLANQLNNFVNYNMPISDPQQDRSSYSTSGSQNIYQQYAGAQMVNQIDSSTQMMTNIQQQQHINSLPPSQ